MSRHASQRAAEFGIGLDVVTDIASRPDIAHTNKLGETVCVCDAHPDWTVVVGHDDVVVTILRRTHERWEHDPTAARRRPEILDSDDTPAPPVEVARRAADVTRRRSSATRRPAPLRVRDVVVSTRVDPGALRLARELADGDVRRLVINRDGSVTVLNQPRGSSR